MVYYKPALEADRKKRRKALLQEIGRCALALLAGLLLGLCFGAEHLIKFIR